MGKMPDDSNNKRGLSLRRLIAVSLVLAMCGGFATTATAAEKKPPPGKDAAMELPEYDSVFFIKKKDPILAGMLSWYMPGLGQYYS
ncbi:MAG TPA: hypothetical protein ENN21_00835, partial [Spirochaetes bacterium]|nr:hypothetical protein [Spirochaetota bacterium]